MYISYPFFVVIVYTHFVCIFCMQNMYWGGFADDDVVGSIPHATHHDLHSIIRTLQKENSNVLHLYIVYVACRPWTIMMHYWYM